MASASSSADVRDEAARSLCALEASGLFAEGVPLRRRVTHAEQAALTVDEVNAEHARGREAVALVPDWAELAEHVRAVGEARCEAAVPLLGRIWRECLISPVRVQAGHALRAIGCADARAALIAMIDDAEHLSVFLAMRAIFDGDVMRAFDQLAPYFVEERNERAGGEVIPRAVLASFAPSSGAGEGKRFTDACVATLFRDDPRWAALCTSLKEHPRFGKAARAALRHCGRALKAGETKRSAGR